MSEQQKQSTTPEVTAQGVKHALLNELEQQKQVITQLSDEQLEEVAGGISFSFFRAKEVAKPLEGAAAGGSKHNGMLKVVGAVSVGLVTSHFVDNAGGSSTGASTTPPAGQ